MGLFSSIPSSLLGTGQANLEFTIDGGASSANDSLHRQKIEAPYAGSSIFTSTVTRNQLVMPALRL